MTKLLDSHKADAVREAALAGVTELGSSQIDYRLLCNIAKRLGSDYNDPQPGVHSWEKMRLQDRFTGKVDRGLRKLSEEGQLRRSGPSSPRPDGANDRYVTYWTDAAWAEAEQRARRREEGRAWLRQRWTGVAARLEEHTGLKLDSNGLSPAEWEWLLDRAGWR